jgi:putative glutamine amidotransferase
MLLQDAFNLYKPIFAICYGVQILNVWTTGTLIQHLPEAPINHSAGSDVLQAHEARFRPGSRMAELAGKRQDWINSSHHQAIEQVGHGLTATAWSLPDEVIEAVEGTNPAHWILGVQWHPERTFAAEPLSRALFADFAKAVNAWKPRAVTESVVGA